MRQISFAESSTFVLYQRIIFPHLTRFTCQNNKWLFGGPFFYRTTRTLWKLFK